MTGSPWTQPFKWTQEKIEQLIALWNKEYTGLEIAEVIGVTRGAVMGKINRLGLMPSGRGTSPLRSTAVRAMKAKQKAEIAERQKTKPAVKRERERRPPATAPQVTASSLPPIPAPRASHWTGMAAEIDVTEPWECHWPLGASYAPPTAFCKAPVAPGTSYCPYHDAMAHSPSQAKQWYESGRHQ